MNFEELLKLYLLWKIVIPVIVALVLIGVVYILNLMVSAKDAIRHALADAYKYPPQRNEFLYNLALWLNWPKPQHWSELEQFQKDRIARGYAKE